MDQFQQIASALREQMSGTKSRSDILISLVWAAGMPLTAMLGSIYLDAPEWVTILLACFASLAFLIYGFAFVFCLFTDKDALRSEKFTLTKLAIEHGLVGDNVTGVIDVTARSVPTLPSAPQSSTEQDVILQDNGSENRA